MTGIVERIESYSSQHGEPLPHTRKLTAERLAKVDAIQKDMRKVAQALDALAAEEEGDWQPGSPGRPIRVDPLVRLATEAVAGIETLEHLYS